MVFSQKDAEGCIDIKQLTEDKQNMSKNDIDGEMNRGVSKKEGEGEVKYVGAT